MITTTNMKTKTEIEEFNKADVWDEFIKVKTEILKLEQKIKNISDENNEVKIKNIVNGLQLYEVDPKSRTIFS